MFQVNSTRVNVLEYQKETHLSSEAAGEAAGEAADEAADEAPGEAAGSWAGCPCSSQVLSSVGPTGSGEF